jgi:hypothetical protein
VPRSSTPRLPISLRGGNDLKLQRFRCFINGIVRTDSALHALDTPLEARCGFNHSHILLCNTAGVVVFQPAGSWLISVRKIQPSRISFSMCGLKFYSMKIAQDVRDYAATLNDSAGAGASANGGNDQALRQMSEKFRQMGSKIYVARVQR